MSDLIAKMLQACDGVAPNLYADLLVIRDEIERLESDIGYMGTECIDLRNRIAELEGAINRAGGLALQQASHELIRQVLAETIKD